MNHSPSDSDKQKELSKKILGHRIKLRREELGFSQTELALAVGKSTPAYIALIESGDRNIATVDLMLIAKKLETNVSDLLGEKKNDNVSISQLLRSSTGLSTNDRQKIQEFHNFIKEKQADGNIVSLDEISEPRYGFAKSKACELWQNLGEKVIPVDVILIVDKLGIPLKAEEFDMDGVSHIGTDGIAFIQYNKNASPSRQRFTIAHELGHIALEHGSFDGEISQVSKEAQEKEANAFASALLVPSVDLKDFMKNKDKKISDVAERYNVSHDAAYYAISNSKLINKVKQI